MVRKIIVVAVTVLVAAFLAIQLVPVARDNPPIEEDIAAPAQVQSILRRACYDCHSNETSWPWYSRVAPVSWLVSKDVREARQEFNFSTWNRYRPEKRKEILAEMWEEVDEGEMPLPIYLLVHREARLTERDLTMLRRWTGDAGAYEQPPGTP